MAHMGLYSKPEPEDYVLVRSELQNVVYSLVKRYRAFEL